MPPTNPGLDFSPKYLENVFITPSCVEQQSVCIVRKVDDEAAFFNQAKRDKVTWLLNSIRFMDLTTLAGDDTQANVARLAYSAVNPIPIKLLKALKTSKGENDDDIQQDCFTCGAICVYPSCVGYVKEDLMKVENQRRPGIAAVATGFPSGQYSLSTRLEEIRYAIGEGASEIDIVIQRQWVLSGQWSVLYHEIRECKRACVEGGASMKTILSTGELGSLDNVYKVWFSS